MKEDTPKQFASTEEEIAYLREQIANKERALIERNAQVDSADLETIGKQELFDYGTFTPEKILKEERQLVGQDFAEAVSSVDTAKNKADEVFQIAVEKGIHNALTVLDKFKDAHLTDEVHRMLIQHIKSGKTIQDFKEGVPPWHVLHMTLFEVTLPFLSVESDTEPLSAVISKMSQFYFGMQSVGSYKSSLHYSIEIAVSDKSDDIVFYVAVPNEYIDLFEKQILSLFPHANLLERKHDYNIFIENGFSQATIVKLKKHPIYPIRTKDAFESDPLAVILNVFSKLERVGTGAAIQISIRNPSKGYQSIYESIIKRMRDGMSAKESIERSSIGGELYSSIKELIFTPNKKDEDSFKEVNEDQDLLELFMDKIKSPILETNIRVVVSSLHKERTNQIISEINSGFNQFESTRGNKFLFKNLIGKDLNSELKAFSFREFRKNNIMPLSIDELSTVVHFAEGGTDTSPQFKQSHSKTAPAPNDMPSEGTLLGRNIYRNLEREIYITTEDRLRHFYIIGQTGTGKTTLMKNMIVQDIEHGDGVCMIDPHGTDIEDVLGSIPKEREEDIIYFDPSKLDRVVGLNMLEYDENKPEQKTFVVNELFSIFQKLYGANPESMGPMFEQYFRNATLLVMDDPKTGNTLMDISRVMSDSSYRRLKLSRAKNPVVIQFWNEIATKAGGEASLENIVPYIVSKFDVFTANDYMRPIIGQQKSAFNFRQIMDEKKILLVNLSKGRLGDINANLIGMIIVGKILMAALSRVDDQTRSFPQFYLHMDEFQNISTNSIASILSEARKYKLGLTIAHQFIAQLDEKIKDAVFGNVGSTAVFRVGPEDSEFFAGQFKPTFEASDLMNIPNRNAYVRMLADGTPTKPFSITTNAPREVDLMVVQGRIDASYKKYGVDRKEIEDDISARYSK